MYTFSSSFRRINDIQIPTIFLNSVDDPLFTERAFNPVQHICATHPRHAFIRLKYGGHLGFLEGSSFSPNSGAKEVHPALFIFLFFSHVVRSTDCAAIRFGGPSLWEPIHHWRISHATQRVKVLHPSNIYYILSNRVRQIEDLKTELENSIGKNATCQSAITLLLLRSLTTEIIKMLEVLWSIHSRLTCFRESGKRSVDEIRKVSID